MNQTQHYGLSQWDLTDRVEMKDFNADNFKLDAALAALAGTQTAESARLDTALAAAKAELAGTQTSESARLDKAMAAETKRVNAELAKKALAADLDAAKTALETSVSGLSSSKLEQVTLLAKKSYTLSGTSATISVSGSQMSKCSLAMAIISTSGLGTTEFTFFPNGNTNASHHVLGSTAYTPYPGLFHLYPDHTHVLFFLPMKGLCPYISGVVWSEERYALFYSPVKYSALTNLTLKLPANSSSSATLSGGGVEIQIYGLR